MTELSLTERIVVAHFEAGQPAPESYTSTTCPSYSHGVDGWRCWAEGPHTVHRNANGDVTW